MADATVAESSAEARAEAHEFQAETRALLNLVINSLYTHKEVFLRELLSNASDALDKARVRSLTEHDLLGDDKDLEVWITPDPEAKTLTISDSGVGMNVDELKANLGTIAKSGSAEFVKQLTGDAKKDANLIGQFGVGFYSAFLVADRVRVVSRAAGSEEAHAWESSGEGTFTVEPATRERRGTDVILHLRDDQAEYLEPFTIKRLVGKYSDFVGHPIKMVREEAEGEGEEAKTSTTTETLNKGKALWTRPKAELTDEQYEEFYKHVSHDWEAPLCRTHFSVEGVQQFTGLLFVPKRPPFDLFLREHRSGVRLYVKRIFVMDECDALVPEYLRFLRGVVDSDDLPLNVSREVLQADRMVEQIKKQVTKKALDMLLELAEERPDDYRGFWEGFGRVIKEGLHLDPANKDKLAKLMRWESSAGELTSLADYVGRMKEGQEKVYFIAGPDKAFCEKSPHIEGLRAKGYEVLYFTDAVDEWVAMALPEFEGKQLVSAMKGELDIEGETKDEEQDKAFDSLTQSMKKVLEERVGDVRLTDRLTDSPVCLVAGQHDAGANLERILKAAGQANLPGGKRILELNAKHALIKNLQELASKGGKEQFEQLREWTELLHDQALLTEGSPIDDPADFARRMNALLLDASSKALSGVSSEAPAEGEQGAEAPAEE